MDQEVGGGNRQLPRSVKLLAEIAVYDAGAAGYAVFIVDPHTGQRELKLASGVPVPDSQTSGLVAGSFPLRIGDDISGILTFVFRGTVIRAATRIVLERTAAAIEAVWRLAVLPSHYARDAARVGAMETELADAKIADRALGMLANGSPPAGAIDTIVRHVESVIRPGPLQTVIQEIGERVEREIAERQVASRAKALLQSRYGMSEDQAHVHLRLVSRRSRKRLRDVARDVLQEPWA